MITKKDLLDLYRTASRMCDDPDAVISYRVRDEFKEGDRVRLLRYRRIDDRGIFRGTVTGILVQPGHWPMICIGFTDTLQDEPPGGEFLPWCVRKEI